MTDVVMVGVIVSFVGMCIAYIGWCDRIISGDAATRDGAAGDGETESNSPADREQAAVSQ